MSDDKHIDTLLDSQTPEEEFAEEIKAYEEEEAKAAPAEEPEADDEAEEETLEADADQEQQQEEPEEPAQKQSKQVPIEALHAARNETQQLRQQMNQMAMMVQQLQQSMAPQQGVMQLQNGIPQQPEAAPDPSEDPIGALEYALKQQQENAQRWEQFNQQQQQQAMIQQVHQQYQAAAQQFAAQAPDYGDAYQHLFQNRVNELQHHGYSAQDASARAQQEAFGLVVEAFQQGHNPAERIYNLARFRGYQTKAQQRQQAPQQPQQRDDRLDAAKKAAATNTNRSAPPSKALTLEQIADLEGAAFDKAMAKWEREQGYTDRKVV